MFREQCEAARGGLASKQSRQPPSLDRGFGWSEVTLTRTRLACAPHRPCPKLLSITIAGDVDGS